MKKQFVEFEVKTYIPGWPDFTERRYFDSYREAVAFIKKMRPILSDGMPAWKHPQFGIEKIITTSNPFFSG